MSDSKIEWTDKTWNPITGCSKISPGCKNCYAERMAKRLAGRYGYDKDDPFKVTFHPNKLSEPLKWKRPSKIFVCSMGDLFHNDVPFDKIAAIFGVMAFCQSQTFMILTKRPERMLEFFSFPHRGEYQSNLNWWMNEACLYLPMESTRGIRRRPKPQNLPLPNVWLGVTAENQEQADKRIPILLQIPAAVRFVSVEPMLGPINLKILKQEPINYGGDVIDSLEGIIYGCPPHISSEHRGRKLNWVICGAETGPGKRHMELQWAIDLHEQCEKAGVPYFFKKDSNGKFPAGMKREWPI